MRIMDSSALACGGNACRDFITLWFTGIDEVYGQFTLCGSMLLVWLATKAVAPRYAVIAAMIIGIVIVIAQGDVVTTDVVFKPVLPTSILPLIFRLLTA